MLNFYEIQSEDTKNNERLIIFRNEHKKIVSRLYAMRNAKTNVMRQEQEDCTLNIIYIYIYSLDRYGLLRTNNSPTIPLSYILRKKQSDTRNYALSRTRRSPELQWAAQTKWYLSFIYRFLNFIRLLKFEQTFHQAKQKRKKRKKKIEKCLPYFEESFIFRVNRRSIFQIKGTHTQNHWIAVEKIHIPN